MLYSISLHHVVQESLDKALTRPGRFDRIVQLNLPDMQGRLEILQHYMKVLASDQQGYRPHVCM